MPVVSNVPADITVDLAAGETVPAAMNPTFTDTCDDNVAIVLNESQVPAGCGYVLTRTWTGTDVCGNSATATQVITVIDELSVVINGNEDICPEEALTLNAVADGANVTYSWTANSGSFNNPSGATVVYTNSTPGTYQVTVNASSGPDCQGDATITVTVLPRPEVSATVSYTHLTLSTILRV